MSGVRRGQPARTAHGEQIREEAASVVRRPDPRRALRVLQTRVRSRAARLASEEAQPAGAPPGARGSTRARVQGDVRAQSRRAPDAAHAVSVTTERWSTAFHEAGHAVVARALGLVGERVTVGPGLDHVYP